jgi:hypothetical protein
LESSVENKDEAKKGEDLEGNLVTAKKGHKKTAGRPAKNTASPVSARVSQGRKGGGGTTAKGRDS